jgi:hypothetical protein
MKVALVFGNSHAGPYVRGHRLAVAANLVECDVHGMVFNGERYEPYLQHTDRGIEYHPAVANDIRAAVEALEPVCLITAVHGSDHWRYGLAHEVRPFDFLVPSLPQHATSPDAELIPYDLLLRRFRGDMDWLFGLVRTVMSFCELPIFHIEAPPPVEDIDLMLRGVYGPTKEHMEKYGLPSVSFRYKIWWIWNHVTKCICEELGIHFVEGPPETRDPNGFLDKRYYLDGVHGTDEYGLLMACQVMKAMTNMN